MAQISGSVASGRKKVQYLAETDVDVREYLAFEAEDVATYQKIIDEQIALLAKLRREKRGLKRALKRALAESGVTTDGVTATQDSAPVWVITVSGVSGVAVIPWQAEG
jgi:hypothetical protein